MVEPYAELLEFNQPNLYRKEGYTRIRDSVSGLRAIASVPVDWNGNSFDAIFDPEAIVEFAGRVDYGPKSTGKFGDRSIIKRWIDSRHQSMLEMADATFFIECSRVVSHELVRHRVASFQQESQRFVKYEDENYSELFFVPEELEGHEVWVEYGDDYAQTRDPESGEEAKDAVKDAYLQMLVLYKELRSNGVPAQIARYVLPNAMRTRLIMKANLREWRHIVNLRTDTAAQPEMQKLAWQIHDQLVDIFPNVMYNAVEGERGVR